MIGKALRLISSIVCQPRLRRWLFAPRTAQSVMVEQPIGDLLRLVGSVSIKNLFRVDAVIYLNQSGLSSNRRL